MGKIFSNRPFPALLLLFLPLFFSGCVNGFWGGTKGAFSEDEGEKTSVATGTYKSAKNPHNTASNPQTKALASYSHLEDSILRQLFDLKNPEEFVPISSRSGSGFGRSEMKGVSKGRKEIKGRADFSYRDAVLSEDTRWRGLVIVEGGVTVSPQATLTVESGTVVRFRGVAEGNASSSLMVLGRLVVNGTVERPVRFSSIYAEVCESDWHGIVLTGSEKKNLMENCRVEGAVNGIDASFSNVTLKNVRCSRSRTGARLQDALAVIDGFEAGECGTGLILFNSEAEVRSASFYGNRLGLFASRTSLSLSDARFSGNNLSGLMADKCRIDISDNSFLANGTGLSLVACEGTISSNRISRNAFYGVVLKGSRVKVKGNYIEGNAKAGLRTEDGQGVAWGNAIFANGEYDLYNGGTEEFRAVGNWWGESRASAVVARIYDRNIDESRGRVILFPPLKKRPELMIP
jgi:parallel beta-helix repeat protein